MSMFRDYRDARAEFRDAAKAQYALNNEMIAAGIHDETPDWLAANARTGEALDALSAHRAASAITSAVEGVLWLAFCFVIAGLTIDWLGTGIWARIFAASNFLGLWFLPYGMPRWLAVRVYARKAASDD